MFIRHSISPLGKQEGSLHDNCSHSSAVRLHGRRRLYHGLQNHLSTEFRMQIKHVDLNENKSTNICAPFFYDASVYLTVASFPS